MTFGMQMRLWYRRASSVERQVLVAGLACIALLTAASVAIAPRPHAQQLGLSANDGDGSFATESGGAPETTVGGEEVPPAGDAGGVGTSGGSPSGLPGATPRGSGAVRAGAGGSTSSSVPLKASDRGITDKQVRVGFFIANLGGFSGAGFALNIRDDADKYAAALAAYANRHGGVLGREVVPYVRRTDPTNQSDQAAACQAMVNDYKVFGVVDVGAIADTPPMQCIATENSMPYVHNTIWGTEWLARSKGMEVGYPAAIDRVSYTWVRDLKAMSWLPSGGVVGILGDKCAATSALIDNVLKPLVEQAGVAKVVVAKHDCDAQSVAGQPGSFVTQFRAAGVTHVLLAANFISNAVFMNAAEGQAYSLKYSVSDWWQAASDSSAKNYPAGQFDGAIAITSNGLFLPQSGKPPWPGWERCNQVAVDAKLPALKHQASDQELWALCDNFFLMMDGLVTAGPNPTRWDWAAAIQRLGQHPSVMFGPSNFAKGKVTGSDSVFTAQWMKDCTCFKAISGTRPAAR